MKRTTSMVFASVFLLALFFAQHTILSQGSTTIDVYPGESIQTAINSANEGDTIFVHAGFYPEVLVVNKSISLIGEGRDLTIIDGNNTFGNIIYIVANNVAITGFTIQNARGFTYYDIKHGILIDGNSSGITITNNTIKDNYGSGIYQERWLYLPKSSNHIITGNIIMNHFGAGIIIRNGDNNLIADNKLENNTEGFNLGHSSYNIVARNSLIGQGVNETTRSGIDLDVGTGNIVSENNVSNFYFGINERDSSDLIYNNNLTNNYYAVWLNGEAYINRFYRNNIINNTRTVLAQAYFGINLNYWDNGFEGNYWSEYTQSHPSAQEIDDTGIWNEPYVVDTNNTDNYPLVKPIIVETVPPQAILLSPENKNYTTTDLQLTFTVDEAASWKAYSLDGSANVTISGNTTITGLFIGTHSVTVYARDLSGNIASSNTVTFTITIVIPEFPSSAVLLLLLFLILPVSLFVLRRKALRKRTNGIVLLRKFFTLSLFS